MRRGARGRAIVGVGLLAAGTGLTAMVANHATRKVVQSIDDRWYELSQRPHPAAVRVGSRLLDLALSTTPDWTARVAVTALLVRQRRWQALAGWAGTIVLGEACIGPIKSVIDRPRPLSPRTTTSQSSYPSGHAIAAGTTVPGIVLALLPPGPVRAWALGGAVGVAAATALSRADLNAHWLSDCVGGFCLGTGFALAVPAAVEGLAQARTERRR